MENITDFFCFDFQYFFELARKKKEKVYRKQNMSSNVIVLDSDEECLSPMIDANKFTGQTFGGGATQVESEDKAQSEDSDHDIFDFLGVQQDSLKSNTNNKKTESSDDIILIDELSQDCDTPKRYSVDTECPELICIDDNDDGNTELNTDSSVMRNQNNLFYFPSSPQYQNAISDDGAVAQDGNDIIVGVPKSSREFLDLSRNSALMHSELQTMTPDVNTQFQDRSPAPFAFNYTKDCDKITQNTFTDSSISILQVPNEKPKSNSKGKCFNSSSSIGSINIPLQKPRKLKTPLILNHDQQKQMNEYAALERSGTNTKTYNTQLSSSKPLSSELSESSDSFREIRSSSHVINGNNILKDLQKGKTLQAKDLVKDLARIRNRHSSRDEYTHTAHQKLIAPSPNKSLEDDNFSSDVINSSSEPQSQNHFMSKVNSEVTSYSEERLEFMLDRARRLEPKKLAQVNQKKINKDELIGKITCSFSSQIDEKLKSINSQYADYVSPAHHEVLKEGIIPVIKFKRYVDSLFYEKRKVFIPINGSLVEEEFLILVYYAEELIPLFKEGIMKRHIKYVRHKYPTYRVAVWLMDYDKFVQKLMNQYNKLMKQKVQQELDGTDENCNSRKKRKSAQSLDELIKPSDLEQTILSYEIKYNFSVQKMKGIKELTEWLKYIAYTLSSKHIDNLERNQDFKNIGKVKSGDKPQDVFIQMLTQFRGITENRARKFVDTTSISDVGNLFRSLKSGEYANVGNVLRSDHNTLIQKVLLSKNENDLL